MPAACAAGRGKAVGENAAGQALLAVVPFDVSRDRLTVLLPGTRLLQPRFHIPLHHLLNDLFGLVSHHCRAMKRTRFHGRGRASTAGHGG